MNVRRAASAFAAGALFSVGLIVAGMTVPGNIVGFLDFFGQWKPALALVMAGAVGVYAALYPRVLKRRSPLLSPAFELPEPSKIDARLLVGASAFGIGWGLGGFCPGPALATLGAGAAQGALFVGAMAAGIVLHHLACKPSAAAQTGDTCG